jgi:hypothetical protein
MADEQLDVINKIKDVSIITDISGYEKISERRTKRLWIPY